MDVTRTVQVAMALSLALMFHPQVQAEDDGGDGHAVHREAAAGAGGKAAVPDAARSMENIESLLEKVRATKETAQRRELLAQHLGALRAHMRMIRVAGTQGRSAADDASAPDPHAAHGAAGTGESAAPQEKEKGKQKGGMMAGKKMGAAMMKKHQQVEERLDMLERMLQQLIEYEAEERELEQ